MEETLVRAPQPYIGITGFMDRGEVDSVLAALPVEFSRKLMVGVLISSRTLKRGEPKRPNRYPNIDRIVNIFPDDPRALNLLHYNTFKPENLVTELNQALSIAGPHCHGFQLNLVWPDRERLQYFCDLHPNVTIVLQVGGRAFEQIEHSPKKLVEKVFEYAGTIDHILLDLSMGHGAPLDAEMLRPYLAAVREKTEDLIGIGVAGGLGAGRMNLIAPLIAENPDLSWDAEGNLRDENDNLIVAAANQYLAESHNLFS